MIKVKKLDSKAKLPTRNNKSDVGFDLYALEDVMIYAGAFDKVRTGIAIQIEQNHPLDSDLKTYGQILTRSSMASKGVTVSGGVIDPGYRGDLTVILSYNNRDPDAYYYIKAGDKIAQLVLLVASTPQIQEVDELTSSDRGVKGFGSSGT